MGLGVGGLGVGGLGIGPTPQPPTPNPQSPIPNEKYFNFTFINNKNFYYFVIAIIKNKTFIKIQFTTKTIKENKHLLETYVKKTLYN